MKKSQFQEYKNKPLAELRKDLAAEQEKLVNLRFDLAAGKVKNIKSVNETRKLIARLLTMLNAAERQSAKADYLRGLTPIKTKGNNK